MIPVSREHGQPNVFYPGWQVLSLLIFRYNYRLVDYTTNYSILSRKSKQTYFSYEPLPELFLEGRFRIKENKAYVCSL